MRGSTIKRDIVWRLGPPFAGKPAVVGECFTGGPWLDGDTSDATAGGREDDADASCVIAGTSRDADSAARRCVKISSGLWIQRVREVVVLHPRLVANLLLG